MPEIESELELIDKIRRSNKAAFKELFSTYSARLFVFFWHCLGDEILADRYVLNLFRRMWDKRSGLDISVSLRALVYQHAVDLLFYERGNSSDRRGEPLASGWRYDDDEKIQFSDLLEELPETHRLTFILCRFERLSFEEISFVTRESKQKIGVYITNSIGYLYRESIDEDFDEVDGRLQELVIRYFARQASDSDKKRLDEWLDQSEENRQYFQEVRAIWKNATAPSAPSVANFDELWRKLEARLRFFSPRRAQFASLKKGKIWKKVQNVPVTLPNTATALRVIAAVLVLLVVAAFVLSRPRAGAVKTISALEQRQVKLEDGTFVVLDANSDLLQSKSFSKYIRVVYLRGHAYFNVKQENRPFIVQTKGGRIEALGTQFDVYARSEQTRVVVANGEVLLYSRDAEGKASVRVRAGEIANVRLREKPEAAKDVDLQEYWAWIKGSFEFQNTSLNQIAKNLEYNYGLPVNLADPEISKLRFTSSFTKDELKTVVRSVCDSLNLNYRFDGRGYSLASKDVASANKR